MGKTVKSQWDFGDLFSQPATAAPRRVMSVSELTSQIRRMLEQEIGVVWISGEITNFRAQGSGHIYFTLKDAASQLSCVLFRGEPVSHRDLLADGQKVILRGDVTVYEARGQYQLRVTAIELAGIGALQLAFEKLKQRLQVEGLFAAGRKRPIPRYAARIGIVTSPTAAALQDVLQVFRRRHPKLEILISTCRVQGQGAAEEIACAIHLLNNWNAQQTESSKIDLILVTRGGGSLEDLWSFNEEVVARAVFESKLPVVSAVGHEIDFTICDFVADLRVATPSVAAEVISEGHYASREFVSFATERLQTLAWNRLREMGGNMQTLLHRLVRSHPKRRLNERAQRLDELQVSLRRGVLRCKRDCETRFRSLHDRFLRIHPLQTIRRRRELFEALCARLGKAAERPALAAKNRLETATARLRLLAPKSVLDRGYSITRDTLTGRILRNADEVRTGQRVTTLLKAGSIESTVSDSKPAAKRPESGL